MHGFWPIPTKNSEWLGKHLMVPLRNQSWPKREKDIHKKCLLNQN